MSTYLDRTRQRKECARLLRAVTANLDVKHGRGAWRISGKIATRLEEIICEDTSEVLQDAGFYRDTTGHPRRNPGVWMTGGRTNHGGESAKDWVPSDRFWPVLRAVMGRFAPSVA